jgi:hypothetical protein
MGEDWALRGHRQFIHLNKLPDPVRDGCLPNGQGLGDCLLGPCLQPQGTGDLSLLGSAQVAAHQVDPPGIGALLLLRQA